MTLSLGALIALAVVAPPPSPVWAQYYPQTVQPERLEELARPLWEPKDSGYLRDWLICGDFPNPPRAGTALYDHKPPCVGLATDYLADRGGEAVLHPTEGLTHTRPDGTQVSWTHYESTADTIDFLTALDKWWVDNAVGYAFTTLTIDKPTDTYLGISSAEGVRVWLNGRLVHDYLGERTVADSEDIVPVSLRAGENALLVKVETGTGPWEFRCRLLSQPLLALYHRPFTPELVSEFCSDSLVVRPDALPTAGPGELGSVTLEVIRPGGGLVARARPHGAKPLRFQSESWPNGPYEVRCTRRVGPHEEQVAHVPWFKGDAQPLVDRLQAAATQTPADTAFGRICRLLNRLVVKRATAYTWGTLTDDAEDDEADTGDAAAQDIELDADTVEDLHSALMEFAELELAEAGEAPLERPFGFVRMAYEDEVDGSSQFCRVYLPAHYTPKQSWPLVIDLHRAETYNPEYLECEDVDRRHHWWADEYGVIVLVPHGRGNSWFKGLGLKDVLRCLGLAKIRFSVDDDRVYLTGRSMGGGGVWELGTRYPQLFAALAPVYGGWDDRLFQSDSAAAQLTPRQQFYAECYSSFSGAESLLTTPMLINHGTADTYVNVNHSRLAVKMLQRWGYAIRYREHLGKGHEVWSDDRLDYEKDLLHWLLQHRRAVNPPHVRIRAADLKSASVHWVRVENREDPQRFIHVDAEIIAPNVIRLRTENVLALTLSPAGELIDRSKPLAVDWNGRSYSAVAWKVDGVTLTDPAYRPAAVHKSPEREGPIADVFTTPFVIIVGTISRDSERQAACRKRADSITAQWEKDWHAEPRVLEDVKVVDEVLERYSLVLIGGPDDNAVTRRLRDRLPLKLEGDVITLAGREFTAPDTLVRFVHPHPFNPRRYVLVDAATSAKAFEYTAKSKDALGFLLAHALDFYLTDGKQPDEKLDRPEEKVFVASGYFDHNWRYDESLVVLGDPEVRATCSQQGEYTFPDTTTGYDSDDGTMTDPYGEGGDYDPDEGYDGYEREAGGL